MWNGGFNWPVFGVRMHKKSADGYTFKSCLFGTSAGRGHTCYCQNNFQDVRQHILLKIHPNFMEFGFVQVSILNTTVIATVFVISGDQVFHDRETWCISVRLSYRSKVTHHKINFAKNCLQWGLNPWPPDHQSYDLPIELGRNQLKISEVELSSVLCTTSNVELSLFLESIEHDFIKALVIHTDNQIVT